MRIIAMLALLVTTSAHAEPATDLDALWKDACLWEVGSNTEKVPAARKALIAEGDRAVAYLVPEKLDTKDTLITRALSVVLTGVGASAAPPLRAALRDARANVRRNAADLLGQLNDAESAGEIAALLADKDTRSGALTALGALKAQGSVPQIAAVLMGEGSPLERERVLAAAMLGRIGGPTATTALVAALSDHAAQVRFAAQVGLEALKATDALVPLVGSGDMRVRLHAIDALGTIADPAARPALLPLLKDESPIVRGHAAASLHGIGSPDDLPALHSALALEKDPFARGKMLP
jgi:HEAT repeat protein